MSGGTWWSQGLSLAITVVVVSWMMRVMVAAGRAQAARGADGIPELRYPRWYAWLGIAVAMIGTVMVAVGGPATWGKGVGGFLLVVGIGGAMAAGGIWMTFEMLRRVIRVHADRVEMIDLRGRSQVVRWTEVAAVRFRPMAGYLVLVGTNGVTIQASLALAGLQSLIDGVRGALPAAQWAEALRALEEYRTRQGA